MAWGRFLLFCVPQSVKTKETNPVDRGPALHVNRLLVRNGSHSYTNIGAISVQKVRLSLTQFANRFFIFILFFRVQEFAMVDVKTEGKERETDDLKSQLEEEGKFP